MTGFWNPAHVEAQGPLTRATLQDAIDAIYAQSGEPDPCSLGHHVLHPRSLHEPGWYVCGNCAGLVEVTRPLAELR